MSGRVRRKLMAAREAERAMQAHAVHPDEAGEPVCPLCERPIPRSQQDAHHLVPKSKGGRYTAYLHRICHRQIHALFTETELARQFHTVDALLAHPEMGSFVTWVRSKPPEFYERTRKSLRIRRR